ncbi:MAG: PAS domain S-box protein [Bacteroidetes bacterium]|nr:PAS domain S-box protein [Bacteroidota bacterium]
MKELPDLSSLWNSLRDCVIQTNTKGIILNWNIGAQKSYGYKYKEILGKPISILFPSGRKNEYLKILKKIKNNRRIYYFETELIDKRRNKKNVQATILPIKNNDGGISGTILFAIDLTQKEKLIEDLQLTQKLYRDIVEMSPNINGIIQNNKIVFLNSAGIKALGIKNISTLVGKSIEELIYPDDLSKFRIRNKLLLKGKKLAPTELRLKKNDSLIIIVESYERFYRYMGKPAIQFAAKDITKRKTIEEERENLLKITREYAVELDAIFESIPDAIYVGDKTKIRRANSKLLDLYNLKSIDEMNSLRSHINKILKIRYFETGESITAKESVFANALKGKSIVREIVLTDPHTSKEKIIRSAGAPIKSNGKAVGAIVINSDITELKKIEKEIIESESRYKSLIEQSFDGIALINNSGKLIIWNSKLLDLLGYDVEEILNVNFKNIIQAEIKKLSNEQKELEPFDKNLHFESEVIRKNKSHFPAEINISILDDEMIMYVIRDISERKAAEELHEKLFNKLIEAQNVMKNLSRQLIIVQEQEKRNIARELHDEIGQTLTAIKIDILNAMKFIPSLSAQEQLKDSIQMVEETLNNVREMSLNLRPSILDDLGLIPAVRWFLDRQSQRTGINAKVITKPFTEKLPSEIQITCYRIIQEAVTNIIRHSKAKNMSVEINITSNELYIIISDDGVGYDVLSARRMATSGYSIGVLGMQERAEAVGGWLDIFSRPNEGTKIHAIFPLKLMT